METIAGASYFEWNDGIAKFLFEQGNDATLLYVTKEDIIEIGRSLPKLEMVADELVWRDFMKKANAGIPGPAGSSPDLVTKALYACKKWQEDKARNQTRALNGSNKYPYYICLLVATVISEIEEIRGAGYYERLNNFWGYTGKLQIDTAKLKGLEPVWQDLLKWSEGQAGPKFLLPMGTGHRYVGRPQEQAPLKAVHVKRLPALFEAAELLPRAKQDLPYDDDTLLEAFKAHAVQRLGITEPRKKELLKEPYIGPLVSQLRKAHARWDGEEERVNEKGEPISSTFRGQLVLQFEEGLETLQASYRVRSKQELPEGLSVLGNWEPMPIVAFHGEWSKKLALPFLNGQVPVVSDPRWQFKPETMPGGATVYVKGQVYGLDNAFWIQAPIIAQHYSEVRVLCETEKKNAFLNWQGAGAKVQELPKTGIPKGYAWYKVTEISASHPDAAFSALQLPRSTDKKFQLLGGVAVKGREHIRCYLDYPEPQVQLMNATGTEKVELIYEDGSKIELERHKDLGDRWILPQTTRLNQRFRLESDNVRSPYFQFTQTLGAVATLVQQYDEGKVDLPKRNSDGKRLKATEGGDVYMEGCQIISNGSFKRWHEPYLPFFTPSVHADRNGYISYTVPTYDHHAPGNQLLAYLSLKGKGDDRNVFYSAFKAIREHAFREKPESSIPDTPIWVARNYMEYLGHLELEHDDNGRTRFTVNRPRLILIPYDNGHRALLTGARDPDFIEALLKSATRYHVEVHITPQTQRHLLLPDRVVLKAMGNDWKARLTACAKECKVEFEPADLFQIQLAEHSASIASYDMSLEPAGGQEHRLSREIFDPASLSWTKSTDDQPPVGDYILAEYIIRAYDRFCWIWKGGKPFRVDKNWGRYLTLWHAQQIVAKFVQEPPDQKKTFIPIKAPLPRLLMRSLVLMSGLVPQEEMYEGRMCRVFHHLPSTFIQNTLRKCGQGAVQDSLSV